MRLAMPSTSNPLQTSSHSINELIAGEPGQGVAGTHQSREPIGYAPTTTDHHDTAMNVVDLLEPVEGREQRRRVGAGALRDLRGVRKALLQSKTVGSPVSGSCRALAQVVRGDAASSRSLALSR